MEKVLTRSQRDYHKAMVLFKGTQSERRKVLISSDTTPSLKTAAIKAGFLKPNELLIAVCSDRSNQKVLETAIAQADSMYSGLCTLRVGNFDKWETIRISLRLSRYANYSQVFQGLEMARNTRRFIQHWIVQSPDFIPSELLREDSDFRNSFLSIFGDDGLLSFVSSSKDLDFINNLIQQASEKDRESYNFELFNLNKANYFSSDQLWKRLKKNKFFIENSIDTLLSDNNFIRNRVAKLKR